MYQVYQIQLRFKGQNQKITVARTLSPQDLQKLVAASFSINQKVIGVTDRAGKFFQLAELLQIASASKDVFTLVTAKDLNQESMSFEYYQRQDNPRFEQDADLLELPALPLTKCQGTVCDLELFEEMLLADGKVTAVACFTKTKPPLDTPYDYYLFQNDTKNSLLVYSGTTKVCEFYVTDWNDPNPEIATFIQALTGEQPPNEQSSRRSGQFKKRSKIGEGEIVARDTPNEEDIRQGRDVEAKQSFLQNLSKMFEDGEVSELQFYKMKSQVLQNPQDFIRKYQMGTRLGLRGGQAEPESRQEVVMKEERRERGRSANRTTRYEIPIIVRKYNNVVEKISTSYPLTLEQEQAINLILELELKGLISEKEAGQFKSLVLQEDQETFKLFREYFDDRVDQIELASRLRKKRGSAGREESRERVEHDMRLLIKHAKQNSYELLRKLALEGNRHVLGAMEAYRSSKNVEQLAGKLEKIAGFYRAKEDLEEL